VSWRSVSSYVRAILSADCSRLDFVPGREFSMCVVFEVYWSSGCVIVRSCHLYNVLVEGKAFIASVECDGFCRHVARKPPIVSPAIYHELPLLPQCIISCPGIFF
jgi:hypothetical protein